MPEMVDLARTKAEKEAEAKRWKEGPGAKDGPDYPWGLTLNIDYETMKKLGLTDTDFDAGQPVEIRAQAMITEDRVEVINGEKRHSVCLQLQKMAIAQNDPNVAEKFYAEKASG